MLSSYPSLENERWIPNMRPIILAPREMMKKEMLKIRLYFIGHKRS